MNSCRGLGMVHDSRYRIGYVEHKTGRKLTVDFASINKTGCIGNELTSQHHVGHRCEEFISLLGILFRGRNVTDHAADDIRPFLNGTPLCVLQRIAFANHTFGIEPQRRTFATGCWCGGRSIHVCDLFAESCAHLLNLSRGELIRTILSFKDS